MQLVDLAAWVQAAIGEKWKAGTIFIIVIGSDGKVLYKKEGLIEKAGAFPIEFTRPMPLRLPIFSLSAAAFSPT